MAIDRLLGIINARAKLTGSFAPQKLENSGSTMTPEGAIVISPVDYQALEGKLEAMLEAVADNLAKAPPGGR